MKLALAILAMSSLAGKPAGDVFMRSGGLEISREGYQLILDHEVGGGAVYYSRYLQRPTWPGASSGVTIGIGYDLGYNTRAQIDADWSGLSSDVRARLKSVAGVKGLAAKRLLPTVSGIAIPWDDAREVFERRTIPRFAALTVRAYPGVETLHPHIQSANLSWVFNRGSGVTGSVRDAEKRLIRRDTPTHPERLPGHYRASKRLWRGKGVDGLIGRREDEARLVEAALPSK